jgi:oxygen-independent coproporphyrinogen-3 oxidase
MLDRILRHLERRLPRYTSYPTAPHFSEAIGADTYRRWLGAVALRTPVSLYLHIPFCRELCWFCGCSTRVVRKAEIVAQYAERLMAEVELVADALPANLPAGQVHFGGGSPNSLAPETLARIVERIDKRFWLGQDTEVAVELDPRTTDEAFVRACAAAGVTRASVGVQDLDPAVQRAINRIQPYDTIRRLMAWLQEAGIGDINIDLMYGLPHQTVDGLFRTIAQVVRLEPARIALFGYAHVPWMKPHQMLIDESALPGPEERAHQAEATAKALMAAGYMPIGMDHFALPESPLGRAAAAGLLRRNFQGYTTDPSDVLLGFGASAIGMLREGYVQNTPDVRGWAEAIDSGRLATSRGFALDDDDRLRRAVIERLMCDMAVDLDAVARSHGRPAQDWTAEIGMLRQLQADGLVDLDGKTVRVRPQGRALIRAVAAVFDRYLADDAGAPKHAVAV